jgi:hypothetical protein
MIHYVCIATDSRLYFPYLKQLLPELVVLGTGIELKGFIMKLNLLVKYLETLNEDDVVCYIDAYNVLPTKNIVKLEEQFIQFSKENPEVKMITGGEEVFYVQDIINSIVLHCPCINSGTYIGYSKNILYILKSILNFPNIYDDQIELARYAKDHDNEIYIDSDNNFFRISSRPLQQLNLNGNTKCSFIHANLNGHLDNFLSEHHNICLGKKERLLIFKENCKGIYEKIKLYMSYSFKLIDKNRLKYSNEPSFKSRFNYILNEVPIQCII